MTISMYHVLKAGGLGMGGCNFDAKVRRQSFTPEDLVYAHVGGVDMCAHAFLMAVKLIEDGQYDAMLAERYAGWKTPEAQAMLNGKMGLAEIAAKAEKDEIQPQPRSGKQERMENLLARAIYS